MNKTKIIFYSFIASTLLMTGCGCGQTNTQPPSSASPESSAPSAQTTPSATTSQDNVRAMITAEEAKTIALQHADLVAEEVTFSKCELDEELDGTTYDVEFYTEDRIEFDYEIDAYNGAIISYERDGDDILFDDSVTQDGTNASQNTDAANNSN